MESVTKGTNSYGQIPLTQHSYVLLREVKKFQAFWVLRSVLDYVVTDVSKDRGSFVLRVKQSVNSTCRWIAMHSP